MAAAPRVLQVCAEIFPLLKTGGLADVAGALPAALQREIGFPWSERMVERSRRSVGATIAAARTRYVQPFLGNNGTCGRNTERMNRIVNFDWSFSKKFQLLESGPLSSGPFALEARAELFNIFNIN